MTQGGTPKPDLTIAVDGTHDGWQLAQSSPGRLDFVRGLDDDEADRLTRAVYVVRDHIRGRPTRLLAAAYTGLTEAIATIPPPGDAPDETSPDLLDHISSPLVSWLLMWRLQRENLTADVRTKLRDEPDRWEEFERVKRDVFDNNLGYRLAEGLRDYVQHYASPPLELRRGAHRNRQSETTIERFVRVTVRTAGLMEWGGLKARLRGDLAAMAEDPYLSTVIAEAMRGMDIVTNGYEKTLGDVLGAAIADLSAILAEAAPFGPVFMKVIREGDSPRLKLAPASDVFSWLFARASGQV